ncbi:unnamed protein product [Spirodela intermedia]|uniref:DUF7865 domain-containing protein n=1 Tax=Spirodela intermedia TaxID=51605 RepID=A0A7I8JD22_SPIIN|nr:unnamed protein product [Spirodela intermedia]CAA6667999.1 unnamed protein product [Spirodela intermedia]
MAQRPVAVAPPSPSSSAFFAVCILQAAVAATCGALMMFYLDEVAVFGHGSETARKLRGSTPHDQLLIQTSDSFAGCSSSRSGSRLPGLLRKGCVLLHAAMALWRIFFERRLEDLAHDWPRQLVGDLVLSLSWILFLVYSWREKYD